MNRKSGCKRILACFLSLVLLLPTVSGVVLADDSTDYSDAAVISESGGTETTDSGQEETVVADRNAGDGTEQTSDVGETEAGTAETDASAQQNGNGETAPAEPEPTPDADTNSLTTAVTSWNWVDPDGILQENGGVWGLGAAGASEENPLTREALLSLLPSQIEAETEAGEPVTLELTWDLSEVPEEGIWTGTISLAAALPEGYILAEGAAAPEVTLELGGGETYADSANLQANTVEGISPQGTTINVFDYWLDTQTANDQDNPSNYKNIGINNGSVLKFGKGMGQDSNTDVSDLNSVTVNEWTEDADVRQGIINPTLTNGYPTLSAQVSSNQQSLSYLFDPSEEHDGKASYSNAGGLLQVNSEGYYYYNSTENFAQLNTEENNEFILYKKWGVYAAGSSPNGQFFPFNTGSQVFENEGTAGIKPGSTRSTDANINHYFGLTMNTRFVQQEEGFTGADNQTPVTYEFSGDDDVWVFIDGVLVADLGGIHDAATLKIDFSTGIITINEGKSYEKSTTLKEQFEAAGAVSESSWEKDTFANDTYHTLSFFYLERGNTDSNMFLQFNLVTVPESSLIKVDQTGERINGAKFELKVDDTTIATGTTETDGTFVFIDDEGFIVSINDLYTKYSGKDLILSETYTPPGYRKAPDVTLKFYRSVNSDILLLSADPWTTGAYAMPKVTTTASTEIVSDEQPYDPAAGIMFAVVRQRQEDGSWYPVYGDPEHGWTVLSSDSMQAVLEAASYNWYQFYLTSSGSYQVNVENLPGDIKTYSYILGESPDSPDKAKYTVSYYYSSAKSRSEITEKNTVLLNSADGTKENFSRVFSTNIYVANIKNRLLVQKVDEEGSTVQGAEFSLYKEDPDAPFSKDEAGNVVIPEETGVYDTVITSDITGSIELPGGGIFPSNGKILDNGTYYLKEKNVPEGYVLNTAITKIIIDDTGVYADAGTAEDGIAVLRGVGSIVKSMVQFATDDDVDTTLHDIKASLQTNKEYDSAAVDSWETTDQIMHLQFENKYRGLEYGPYNKQESEAFDINDVTLKTDVDWSRLIIQQCLEENHQSDPGIQKNKNTVLGETNLVNLFSGTVTVQVENQRVGSLKITKHVFGENAPVNSAFIFDIALTRGTSEDGSPIYLEGNYSASVVGNDGEATEKEVKIENGKGTVTLQAGQSVQFDGIPVGTQFTVTEQNVPAGYTPSVSGDIEEGSSGNTASGVISHTTTNGVLDNTAEVLFTNTYSKAVTLTGETALKVQKTLEGRPLTESDKFQFTLTPNDETAQAIKNGKIQVADGYDSAAVEGTQEAENSIGTASFGTITFTEAGSYSFTILEDVPASVSPESPILDGISYDTHPVTVAVTVTQNPATGLLEASVTYGNGDALTAADQAKTDVAAFTNRIVGDFSFVKTDKDKNPLRGAVFAIYRLVCEDVIHTDHNTSLIEVSNAETGDIDPAYAYAECWELAGFVTSNEGGNVQFTGLTINNEYRLVELKAPGGYVLPEGQWRITYDSETGSFKPMEGGAVGNPVAIGNDRGNYYIENYRPTELPVSGFGGIQKFLLIGGTLMACGAVAGFGWYLHRGRKPAAEKSRKTRG